MPTSNNDTRTPKTVKKPATASGGASSETPARKRTVKKTADATVASASKIGPGPAAAPPKPAAVASEAPAPKTPSAPAPVTSIPRPVPFVTGPGRPDPTIAKVVDADERRRMIAEAAYHKFLQRGPGTGTPNEDWMEAEAEIDALLAEHKAPRAQ